MTSEIIKSRFNPNIHGKQIASEPKKKDIQMLSGELYLYIYLNNKKLNSEKSNKKHNLGHLAGIIRNQK